MHLKSRKCCPAGQIIIRDSCVRKGVRATVLLSNHDFHILIVTYSDCVISIITLSHGCSFHYAHQGLYENSNEI